MVLPVSFLPEALEQIEGIKRYITDQGSPEAGRHFAQRLLERCLAIGNLPYGGTLRDDYAPRIRSVPFRRAATIYYRVDPETVLIVCVLYRGRNAAAYFRSLAPNNPLR